MPWKLPQPLEAWTAHVKNLWAVEVWTRFKFFTFTWTPGVIAASTMTTFTMAATGSPDIPTNACIGLRIGMGLKLTSPSAPPPGLVWDCTVIASDTMTIWLQNLSGSPVTAPSGNWVAIGIIT